MQRFVHKRHLSFRFAFAGLAYALRTQPNIWIHLAATILVCALGIWLQLDASRWIPLIVVIGLVWVTELFNTALEALTDLVSPEYHPNAKVAKDAAAAAVLLSALTAGIVGLIVLGPPLLQRLEIF